MVGMAPSGLAVFEAELTGMLLEQIGFHVEPVTGGCRGLAGSARG